MSENKTTTYQLPLAQCSLTHDEYMQIMHNAVFEKNGGVIRLSLPDLPLSVECGIFDDETNKLVCFHALDRIMGVRIVDVDYDRFQNGGWEKFSDEMMSKEIIEK